MANISALLGSPQVLQFAVVGTVPLQYQWRLNQLDLAGETNAALNLGLVQMTDSGSYTLVVKNRYGTATSSVTTLAVVELDLEFLTVLRRPDGYVQLTMRLPLGHLYLLEQSMDLENWSSVSEIAPTKIPHEVLVYDPPTQA